DTTPSGAAALKPQTPSTDIRLLQSAIRNIDRQAREGLGNIGAIAYVSMRWLETPDAYQGNGSILHTILGLLQERADYALDLIGNAADTVGCSEPDKHKLRCWAAVRAARNGAA
ncbi:MAG: hypothetical protein LBI48_11315, partial [Burkholderiaceae bacterium]|nr:hypothetical protein [Burkholderiaceae bacterium]